MLSLVSLALCVFLVWLALFLCFPISGLHPPRRVPLVFPLLRVSVSSSYHPCPSSSLPASSPHLPPSPCLPCLPSHPWIPAVPFSLPSLDLHCPPPSLLGPTFLDTLPPVVLEATSPSIFSSRRS